MSRIDLDKITNDPDDFDCRERLELFFRTDFDDAGNPTPEGEWQWQYTLEHTNGTFINRRVGTTGLNNPRIRPDQLHRALCHDKSLGIYIPKTHTWFHPVEGQPKTGWAFIQKQHHQRARAIERKVQAFLDSQS